MAAGNFGSPMQLIILLAIVLLLFGGKRLRNLGGDLGGAIKGFKEAVAKETTSEKPAEKFTQGSATLVEHEPVTLVEASASHEKSHHHHGG